MLTENGLEIAFIENPTEEEQLAAVTECASAIFFIVRKGIIPSPAVQLTAVKKDASVLRFFKEYCAPQVHDYLLERDPFYFKCLPNPTREQTLYFIKTVSKGENNYLKQLDETLLADPEIQLAAVQAYGCNLQYLKNPSREVILEAIKQNWGAVLCVKDPTEEMILLSITVAAEDGKKSKCNATPLLGLKRNGVAITAKMIDTSTGLGVKLPREIIQQLLS